MSTNMDVDTAKETARLEAFSDGVFGFAITLLVLDIRIPTAGEHGSLFQMLLAQWPIYLAFIIGFFTILICWINHHFMFDYIYKNNSVLLLLNGFKLLVVTLTPFATAVLSKYINTPEQKTAAALYTLNFALMGLSMFLVWHYADKNSLLKPAPTAITTTCRRYYLLATLMSLSIFLVSFVSIWLCLALSGIMFCVFLCPERAVNFASARRFAEAGRPAA